MRRSKRAFIVIALIGCLISLLGCTMYGVAKVSEPTISDADSAQVKLEKDILVYRDLTVSVKPQNYYVSFFTIGPVLPIVPIPVGGPIKREGQPFMLVVQMETESEKLTFTPGLIVIHYNNKTYRPTTARGPYPGGGHALEVAKTVPGHKWECRAPKGELASGLGPRTVNGKACFEIDFLINTIRPEDEFRVLLDGIEKNGIPLHAPTLLFRPISRGGLTIMG